MSDNPLPAPEDMSTWDRAQQTLFLESLDGERLMDILNSWTAPTEDATNLERKVLHAPAVGEAAGSLIVAGFVEVVRIDSPTSPLAMDEALSIVLNPTNWWPKDDVDDRASASANDPALTYCLFSTPLGESLPWPPGLLLG